MARPKTLPEGSVTVKTQIPAQVEAAVDDLVAVSGGVSKAAILRQAILTGLQQFADTNPELAQALANAPAVETSAA
jgi:hypothetical protein